MEGGTAQEPPPTPTWDCSHFSFPSSKGVGDSELTKGGALCCNFHEVVIGGRVELHGDEGVLGSPSLVSSHSPMLCNKASELTS